MSTFTKPLRLFSPDRVRSIAVEALVDSGATFSMVPAALLSNLGVEPECEMRFILADKSVTVRLAGQLRVEVEGRQTFTWCIIGDPEAQPLIGAYTLEGARLMVDPANERLLPLIGLLK